MEAVNPSVMVSRLDLVVLDSAVAEIDFCRLPYGFWNIGVFIEQRGGARGHRGGHNPPGRAWASWRALVGASPLEALLRCFLGPLDVFWPKNILWEFRCVWTPFDIDFLRCKKHGKKQQLALDTMSIG